MYYEDIKESMEVKVVEGKAKGTLKEDYNGEAGTVIFINEEDYSFAIKVDFGIYGVNNFDPEELEEVD